MFKKQMRWLASLGLVGMGLLAATPASAATTCAANNTFLSPAGPINLQPDGGTLVGAPEFNSTFTVTATCGAPGAAGTVPLQGVVITVYADRAPTAPADLYVKLGTNAAKTGLPVSSFLPTAGLTLGSLGATDAGGNTQLSLSASSVSVPNLAGLPNNGLIGIHLETTVVVDSSGTTATVGQFGNIFATPELDSIALFGTGALGMAGYALTRLRASRRRTA